MNNEFFRGIIFPRGEKTEKNKKNFRYLVAGMLVTDKPIENVEITKEEISQYFINQRTFGFADLIKSLNAQQTDYPLGTVDNILLSLNDLPEMIEEFEENKIKNLINDYLDDCAAYSSSEQMNSHPNFQKIVDLKDKSVSILKKHLDKGVMVAVLLSEIFKVNVIEPIDGDVKKLMKQWKEFLKRHGYFSKEKT